MKLGIYCRISRIKDGNDLSIGDQSQKGIDKANELGIDYEMYIDEGISGASESISDRPQFERLLGDISAGDITHVFCYDQSRLERNPQMRFVIVDLFKKKNITFITAMGGVEDLNDPQQEFFGDLLSVINKFHVTTTKIKVKSALKLRVGQGKTNGIIPYGYAKGANDMMVIDADESVIVKRIFNMSLSGIGTPTIAETLNKEGVPTRYAKIGTGTLSTKDSYQNKMIVTDKKNIKWSPNTVYSIVRNPIYKGIRTYGGVTLAVAPIFDAEYFQRFKTI